jgi:hypothetical protein
MSTTRNTILLAVVIAAVGVPSASAGTTPTWRHALAARSEALNRDYHLGRFAVPAAAATNAQPAWLKALEARGRAMNQRYSLGTYSGSRSRVDVKTYVAIGAGIAALLAALAIVVAFTRRTSRPKPRVPKSA